MYIKRKIFFKPAILPNPTKDRDIRAHNVNEVARIVFPILTITLTCIAIASLVFFPYVLTAVVFFEPAAFSYSLISIIISTIALALNLFDHDCFITMDFINKNAFFKKAIEDSKEKDRPALIKAITRYLTSIKSTPTVHNPKEDLLPNEIFTEDFFYVLKWAIAQNYNSNLISTLDTLMELPYLHPPFAEDQPYIRLLEFSSMITTLDTAIKHSSGDVRDSMVKRFKELEKIIEITIKTHPKNRVLSLRESYDSIKKSIAYQSIIRTSHRFKKQSKLKQQR